MNKPVMPTSSLSLKLPKADRSLESYRLAASRSFPGRLEGTLNRVAFSAVHVVADPLADVDPWLSAAVDWDELACDTRRKKFRVKPHDAQERARQMRFLEYRGFDTAQIRQALRQAATDEDL